MSAQSTHLLLNNLTTERGCVCACKLPAARLWVERWNRRAVEEIAVFVCVCRWGSFVAHYIVIKWWKSLSDFIGNPLSCCLTQTLTHTHTHTGGLGTYYSRQDRYPSDGVKVKLGHLFTLTPLSSLFLISFSPHILLLSFPLKLTISFTVQLP